MIGYVIRRLLLALPVLAGVVIAVFTLLRMIPGDPCTALLGERSSPAACAEFNRTHGLDRSVPVQLGIYAVNILGGDFGNSIRFSRPVSTILIERIPVTLELAVAALVLAVAVGIPLGILAARRHNTTADVAAMTFANIGVSIPVFWLGLLLAYFFGFVLRETPFALPTGGRLTAGLRPLPFYAVWGWDLSGGLLEPFQRFVSHMTIFNALISAQWEILRDGIKHLVLPAMTLATIPIAIIARMTRSSLLDALQRDYIRTARAKGAGERRVVRRHALRNAMLPVVTIAGLQLGALMGGAILTETVFGLAGVGTALFDAITTRDFPIIQAFTLVIATTYVVVNLAVDITYGYLDPRVRQG